MTSIRNLPLAVRLGGAFGALCLALAIVAFTGVHAMNGLRAETDELAEHHLRAAELLGGMQTRAKDNMSLVAQHLYVRDGDLAAQDAIADGDRGQLGRRTRRPARSSRSCSPARPSPAEYADFAAKRAEFVETQKQALAASRRDGRNVEERTARARLQPSSSSATRSWSAPATRCWRRPIDLAAEGVGDARASAASGTRIIIVIALIAVVLAARPGGVGHPLGRAPGQDARRAHDEPRRELPHGSLERPRRDRRPAT